MQDRNEPWGIAEHVYAVVNYQWLPNFYCESMFNAFQCYFT